MTYDSLCKKTIKDLRAFAGSLGITGASHIQGGKDALAKAILTKIDPGARFPNAPPRPTLDALKAEVAQLTERLNKALDLQALVAQQHDDLHALIATMNAAKALDKQHQAKIEALLNEQTEKMKAIVAPPPAANDTLALVTRFALATFDWVAHLLPHKMGEKNVSEHDQRTDWYTVVLNGYDQTCRADELDKLAKALDGRKQWSSRHRRDSRDPILLADGKLLNPPKDHRGYPERTSRW